MIRKHLTLLCAAVALLALAACSPRPSPDPLSDAAARECIGMLRDGRFDELAARIPEAERGNVTPLLLTQLRTLVLTGSGEMNVVGSQELRPKEGGPIHKLAYEQKSGDKWLLISAAVGTDGKQLLGINVTTIDKPIEEFFRFTFKGKSWPYYAFFALTVLIPAFCAATLYLAVKRGKGWRRWTWAAFILVGAVVFSIDWNSDLMAINPLAVQLFCASFSRPDTCSPWILSFSVPVGAIAWWVSRWQPRKPAEVLPEPKKDDPSVTSEG